MHSDWPLPFKTHLLPTRHHYPPTSTPDNSYPSTFKDRTGSGACIVYLTFDFMLLPLWPPNLTFLLVVPTAALLYFCTELRCLEITPDDKELVLAEGSSLTLTCSGSGNTTWEFKKDDVPYFQVDQVQNGGQSYQIVQSSATSSVLTLWNVSWKHTGVYLCIDQHTHETKEVAVFVPGEACFFFFYLPDIKDTFW